MQYVLRIKVDRRATMHDGTYLAERLGLEPGYSVCVDEENGSRVFYWNFPLPDSYDTSRIGKGMAPRKYSVGEEERTFGSCFFGFVDNWEVLEQPEVD